MFRLTGLLRATRRTVCSAADDMAKGKFFYAVKKGIKPGVYSSWDECKRQVDKFPAASFKKFASEKDAWAFMRGVEPSAVPDVKKVDQIVESAVNLLPKRGPEPLEYIPLGKKRCHSDVEAESHPKRFKQSESSSSESTDGFTYMGDAVVVYTDGCCSANGQKGARAGIGVYWGDNHPLNVAGRLEGRQTNQRAEIQAACKALEQAKENNINRYHELAGVIRQVPGVQVTGFKGRPNSFEVSVNGQMIYSKLSTGMFPDPQQVLKTVKEMVDGGKGEKNSKPQQHTSKCCHH